VLASGREVLASGREVLGFWSGAAPLALREHVRGLEEDLVEDDEHDRRDGSQPRGHL